MMFQIFFFYREDDGPWLDEKTTVEDQESLHMKSKVKSWTQS